MVNGIGFFIKQGGNFYVKDFILKQLLQTKMVVYYYYELFRANNTGESVQAKL